MDYIEKTGKTIDEAIDNALLELGCAKDDVIIEILEKGSKGFLGIGSKKAKIIVKIKFNPEKEAINFLEKITKYMNLKVYIKSELKDNNLKIDISGENIGILIGKRAQTLDSLQYLISLVINKGKNTYINVFLDSQNYRAKRKETLEKLAISLSKKVKNTGKKIVLEPMNNYERRIIHSVLQNDKYVNTYSQGNEPHRYIVITLKEKLSKVNL